MRLNSFCGSSSLLATITMYPAALALASTALASDVKNGLEISPTTKPIDRVCPSLRLRAMP